ncbi:hypothetical protein BC936DRAFT_147910 [Jimgerdemannia flammicorona]|uniref:Ricin B lectin domain-containing protein n=1 Tax=Jimgerdemannia flammicorona TaxID=994334 RepID=A0A433D461_9FUNG|nr:hypothetical protein BC936DRAFT_147910 [Jimgerdemannia flammicorona]
MMFSSHMNPSSLSSSLPSFLPLLLSALVALVPSAHAATSPNAYITGPQTVANASQVPTGFYAFRSVKTGQYLQFIDSGNVITPATIGSANNTIWDDTTWSVKFHGDKNYSIHTFNRVMHEKCVSTRWDFTKGISDAAVMWQCETDDITPATIDFNFTTTPTPVPWRNSGSKKQRRELTARDYDPIRGDKQQWFFLPVDKNNVSWGGVGFDPQSGKNTGDDNLPTPKTYGVSNVVGSTLVTIVSGSHLWNMVPRCIYPEVDYTFTWTPNNTGVTILADCDAGNAALVWEMILIKPKNWPLGNQGDKAAAGTLRSPFGAFGLMLLGALVALASHCMTGW